MLRGDGDWARHEFGDVVAAHELTVKVGIAAGQLERFCTTAFLVDVGKEGTGVVTIELPAEELPERCYYSMFYRCSKLSSVKCLATTMTGKYALASWLEIAGTDESVSTRTLTHASGTPWVNSDEYATELTDWFAPTDWTLVSQ